MTNPSANTDRYEAQLTPRQSRALQAALLSGQRRLEDIRKSAPPWRTGPRAGQRPGLGILARLRECFIRRQTAAEDAAAIEFLSSVLPQALPAVTREQFDTVGHQTFTARAVREGDSQTFRRLSAGRNEVEHERQRLAQREAALDLARQKFRWDSCERFLEWYEDRRAQEIADSGGDNAEKIEALGRIMFGENWREPVPKFPKTTDSEIQDTDSTDSTDFEPANHANERENEGL